MLRRVSSLGALMLFLTSCAASTISQADRTAWGNVKTPTSGPTRIYGAHYKGCLAGAMAMPPGNGYAFAQSSRGRHFAHPSMFSYLTQLGVMLAAENDYIVISDIAQPRGGPLPGSHGSHQNGLDVDIWYSHPPDFRETVGGPAYPFTPGQLTAPDSKAARMLRMAASFPEVDRIFVNPAIKQALCVHHSLEPWMAKLRPWWGHERHFHVRLRCPADEPACADQPPMNSGIGCDTSLQWWNSAEAKQGDAQGKASGNVKKITEMPRECMDILRQP